MRLTTTAILLCISMAFYAQEENSLLWEISGNGLEQPSYLYGTMHVSKKIAFRLDDVFYESLLASDMVALESDPETWLDKDQRIGLLGIDQVPTKSPKGFYIRNFLVEQPSDSRLASYLSSEDRVLNGIMYRTDRNARNFEEDTYLDMFIYQAGKKFGKEVIALEDMEESSILVGRASLNAMKKKPDEWLQKEMQGNDLMLLMQNAYRERNINLLDSIDRAVYTPYYLENMLYIRNENMTRELISKMSNARVFAGIGAAHLPGERGVINLLRTQGFKVKPLTSEATDRGTALKNKFRNTIKEPQYTMHEPEDERFSLMLPSPLYPVVEEEATTYVSPDLANGSYVMVTRVPTYSKIKQRQYTLKDIDQLLFENIPGTIIDKYTLETDGFRGMDITTRLKNGDHQRYRIYLTPLEIIIFKMGGEGNFVLQYGDPVFKSLTFKQASQTRVTLSSDFKDFKIAFPGYHSFTNQKRGGDRSIEGYCRSKDSYYFLKKTSLHDYRNLEEDGFELKQIQNRFYQDLDLDPEFGLSARQKLRSRALFSKDTGTYLYLQTVLRDSDYFLMGILTADVAEAEAFFNSFVIQPASYQSAFESVIDSAMFFTTKTTVKPLKFVESSTTYRNSRTNKPYKPYVKKSVYVNNNNERIAITINKSHDLKAYPAIDSLWSSRKKFYQGKSFRIKSASDFRDKNDNPSMELVLSDTASSRAIRIRNVIRGGLLYELKTITDGLNAESRFVTEFYQNFLPLDTLIGKSMIGSRSKEFFKALRENDSILDQGFKFVKFDLADVDSLKHYIAHFRFPATRNAIHTHLIEELARLSKEDGLGTLEYCYLNSYHNSNVQAAILKVFAKQGTENATAALLGLMEKDLPLLGNDKEIYEIFKPFRDSLGLAKSLFPDFLQFSVVPEYKSTVIDLTAKLLDAGKLKPGHYKKYKDQFLNDAKRYLKKQLAHQSNPGKRYNSAVKKDRALLKDYLTLLLPFAREKNTMDFLHKVWLLHDPVLRTAYVSLLSEGDYHVPENIIDSLARDINSRISLFNNLRDLNKEGLIPSAFRTQQSLAEALTYQDRRFNPDKDSIVFLKTETLQEEGKQYAVYYFKTKSENDYRNNYKLQMLVFDENVVQTNALYRNKGIRIEDTETDEEVIDRAREAFLLRERPRAVVYTSYKKSAFGPFSF